VSEKSIEQRPSAQRKAMRDVLIERDRQDSKWGVQVHDFPLWMTILGEEFGELCKEVLERSFRDDASEERIYEEAKQVSAVALRIMEQVEERRAESPTNPPTQETTR